MGVELMGSLLTQAADWFKARQTPIRSWVTDGGGRYAFAVKVDGQRFFVAAKKYTYHGQASFMTKLVKRAADQEAYLLLFTESGQKYVFDAEHVLEYGKESNPQDSERASKGEGWLDIPVDASVSFRNWYDRGQTPTRKLADPGDDRERPKTPWDVTAWADGGERRD